MPDRNALEQLLHDQMTALELSRGQLGQRLSPRNPSKALRRIDTFIGDGRHRDGELSVRLAEALGVSVSAINDAAKATRDAIEAQAEADYRARFQPHAIWTTERTRPGSTAMAGFINAPARRLLRFPTDLPRDQYIGYCREQAPAGVPLYGPVTGFIINYTPDHAVQYDLDGQALETLASAKRVGVALTRV